MGRVGFSVFFILAYMFPSVIVSSSLQPVGLSPHGRFSVEKRSSKTIDC